MNFVDLHALTLSLPAYHWRQWKSWRIYATPVAKGLMTFLLRSIGGFIPVKIEFITVKFWPYGQPFSRPGVWSCISIYLVSIDIWECIVSWLMLSISKPNGCYCKKFSDTRDGCFYIVTCICKKEYTVLLSFSDFEHYRDLRWGVM